MHMMFENFKSRAPGEVLALSTELGVGVLTVFLDSFAHVNSANDP